jgi:Meiotically up-regulated gene 113
MAKLASIDILYGFKDPSAAVYVLAISGASVKVGVSSHPAQRVKQIQVDVDRPVRVFWAVRLKRADAFRLEKQVHKRLKEVGRHAMGEWFYVAPETAVAVIQAEIKRMRLRTVPDLVYGFSRW